MKQIELTDWERNFLREHVAPKWRTALKKARYARRRYAAAPDKIDADTVAWWVEYATNLDNLLGKLI